MANASVVLQMVPGPQAVSRLPLLPLSVYHSPRSAEMADVATATEPAAADADPRSVAETADAGIFPSPEFMPEEMPSLSREQTRRMRAELRRFLGAERLPAGLSDEDAYRQYRDFRRKL